MTQMTGKITLLLIFILCVYGAKAQVADTTQQYDIFYSSPKTYELAGVRAVGGGENYDEDYLAQMAGFVNRNGSTDSRRNNHSCY